MARQLEELEFKLLDRLSSGLGQISGNFSKLKTDIIGLNQGAELAGKGLGLVVDAARGIGDAVGDVADYETAMRRVQFETQATAAEQVALQAAVRAAGDEFGTSGQDAAAALLAMALEGANAQEAINNLGSVLAFAKGNAESATAAIARFDDLLATFDEDANKVGAVADALSAVAREAGTSTKNLAEGLTASGGAAAGANVSLEQTLTYLGALAERGIEGAKAGKQLTTIFNDLASATGPTAEALKSIGLAGADIGTILARLSTDSAAANKVLATFGDKPKAAMQALLQDGGGAIKELIKVIQSSKGAAEVAARALDGTFNDSLQRLKTQFLAIRDDLGAPLLGPLATELGELSGKLSEFAKSPEFAELVRQFSEFSSKGIKAVGDLLQSFNFEQATGTVTQFTGHVVDNMSTIAKAVDRTAKLLNLLYSTAELGFLPGEKALEKGSIGATTALAAIDKAAKELNDELIALTNPFLRAGGSMGGFGENAKVAAGEAGKLSKAAGITANELKALALAMIPEPYRVLVQAILEARDALDEMPRPAKLFVHDAEAMAKAAYDAAVAIEQIKVINLSRDLAGLAAAGKQSTEEFLKLKAELGESEANIRALTDAYQKQRQASDDLTDSTRDGGDAFIDYGEASKGAAEAVEELTNKNSAVDESFGNITGAVSELTVGFTKLNQAYVNSVLANGSNVGDALLSKFRQLTQEQDDLSRSLERDIELRQRLLKTEDEYGGALDRLREKYRNLTDEAVQPLIDAERRLLDQRKERTKVNDELAASERRAAGQAGGIGAGPRPSPPAQTSEGATVTPAATGAITIVIQGSSMESDKALADRVVQQIERRQRLGR